MDDPPQIEWHVDFLGNPSPQYQTFFLFHMTRRNIGLVLDVFIVESLIGGTWDEHENMSCNSWQMDSLCTASSCRHPLGIQGSLRISCWVSICHHLCLRIWKIHEPPRSTSVPCSSLHLTYICFAGRMPHFYSFKPRFLCLKFLEFKMEPTI